MADTLLILYDQEQSSWCTVSDKKQITSKIFSGPLENATQLSQGKKTTIVLKGLQSSYFTVDLPSANRRKAITAIPFRLEEELSEDINQLKFTYPEKTNKNPLGVIVINKTLLADIVKELSSNGIVANTICPAFTLLPEKHINIYDGLAICHLSNKIQFSCQENLLPFMLESSDANQDELTTTTKPLLSVLAKQMGNIPFNLFERPKSTLSSKKHIRTWALSAAFSVVLLVSYLTSIHLDTQKIKVQSAQKRQLSIDILKKAFPKIKKVRDPRVLMKSKLKQLGKQGAQNTNALTQLLFDVASSLNDFKNINILSINASKNTLELDISAKQLKEIDEIKKILSDRDGFNVTVSAISQDNNGAKGRLRIK